MGKALMNGILAILLTGGCAGGPSATGEARATAESPKAQVPPIQDDISPSHHAEGVTETCKPPYVPDEATAIRIAEAVWLPIYGKGIYEERPFRAELVKDVWIVIGSLPRSSPGGVPIARISREDGRILQVTHTQ